VIFQNRVSRASTVLIPYRQWAQWRNAAEPAYENGFIVLLTPADYFGNGNIVLELAARQTIFRSVGSTVCWTWRD